MLNIAAGLLLVYIFYMAAGSIIQRRIVFPRYLTEHDPRAAEGLPDLDIWHIETAEGTSTAWFLPARGASGVERRPAVIFAYGNAELIEYWAPMITPYREAGLHVLLADYRGYGFSEGKPSQKAIISDFVRFYDRLSAHEAVDSERIVFHGRSLGGGVVCALSRKRPPAALVLSSTFTSIADMAVRFFFPPFLMRDRFDNLSALRGYDGPVLLLHGREDRLIPPAHAARLKANAQDAELVLLPGDHNDMTAYRLDGEAWESILDFMRQRGILPL